MTLRDETIRLAYQNPHLRAHLLPLLTEEEGTLEHRMAYVEPFAWLKNADKGGKNVQQFLKEVGDEKVKNPNPDSRERTPEGKVKSLPNSDAGKGMFQKLFDRWKGDGKDKGKSEGGSGDVDKLKKRFKKPSDKDKMTFYREVKKDNTREELVDKDEVNSLIEKELDKALKMYVQSPPKNAPKKPSMKDIALNYSRKRNVKLKESLVKLAYATPEIRDDILMLLARHAA